MINLKRYILPSNAVFLIAVGLFLYWSFVELARMQTYAETAPESYSLSVFRWPEELAKKLKDKYMETQLPYNERLYKELVTTSTDKIDVYNVANGPDYIIISKRGTFYSVIRPLVAFVLFIAVILNFYCLALILYWLGRGVRTLFKR